MIVDSSSAGLTRVAFLSDISMYRLTDLPANGSWTRSGRLEQALRAKRRLFTYWVNLGVRPNWEGTRTRSMSRRQLPTPKGVHGGNDRYVRRSSEKVSYKTQSAAKVSAKICDERRKKKEVRHYTSTRAKEEENETRSLKKERSVSSRLAYP